MASEPTSALTFEQLIIETARFIGIAFYGTSGTGKAEIPQDPHDLDECKRHVNNAIRMFLADAPSNGWLWAAPTAQVTIWGDINFTASSTLTLVDRDEPNDTTTFTIPDPSPATTPLFFETMELHDLVIQVTSTTTQSFLIKSVVSSTKIIVEGDATALDGNQWKVVSDGNFTLTPLFGGQFTGDITYIADTNQGVSLDWTTASTIRQWRENITDETGDPFWAAVRPMTIGDPRRRWELMLYPSPDEIMTVEFPFDLHFDSLVNLNEVHPAPFSHDETLKAACLAVAEKDVEGALGNNWNYYRDVCLQNSYRIDRRSGPRKLGYFGNPMPVGGASAIKFFRNRIYQRPIVNVKTT